MLGSLQLQSFQSNKENEIVSAAITQPCALIATWFLCFLHVDVSLRVLYTGGCIVHGSKHLYCNIVIALLSHLLLHAYYSRAVQYVV